MAFPQHNPLKKKKKKKEHTADGSKSKNERETKKVTGGLDMKVANVA